MNPSVLRDLVQVHRNIDYGSKASVSSCNVVSDKIRAEIICAVEEGAISELLLLLEDPDLGPWIAYTCFECTQLDDFQKAMCIRRIRSIASENSIEATAAKIWLNYHGYSR